MADQTIALDLNNPAPAPVQPFNPASPLQAATQLQAGQTQLRMLNRQDQAQDLSFRNSLIADAAAHALDADSWDAAMRSAVQRGAPEAAQYIGRYTPLLQQRLFDAYAGASPQGAGTGAAAPSVGPGAGAPAATPADMLDRMYANVSPAQMVQSLQKNNMILAELSTVKDQASYNAAIARLQAAGIPNAAAIAGPYSPLQVNRLWNETQQRVAYLQNRVGAAATGQPAPLVKNEVQNVNGQLYSVNPFSSTAVPLTPAKKEFEGVDKTGTMSAGVFDPVNGTYSDINGQPNASPFTAFAAKVNQAENSTGNPAAKNPASSATGNGQFIDSTWLSTIKAARPDLVKGLSDKQILALRSDPQLSQQMTAAYAQQNAAKLSAADLPVTTATLALAHRFGPDGAATILKAAPSAKLSDILPKQVIAANPQLANLTAGQYTQSIVNQFGNTAMEAQAPTVPADVHGVDYLKTLSPTIGAQVKAYAEGRQPLPTGFALKSPYFQNMLRMITQYDPSFDAVNYNARAGTRRDFTSGKSAQTINSMNTALGHLNMLDQAAGALNNSDYPTWNRIANWYAEATGKPAPTNFKAAAGLVAEELTRVYRQAGGSEADITRHLNDLSANASPEQIHGALYSIAELLKSKLDAMGEQYNQGMGTTEDPLRLLNGPAQASFNRLLSYGPEGTGRPSAAGRPEGGTVVRPSEAFVVGRIYRDAVNGTLARYDGPNKWVPVQASTPAPKAAVQ